jgi:hypothetical protein
MKALFGSLMCLVLTFSQAFAIPGGPFSGNGRAVVVGTYAGVLIPMVNPVVGLADNSLALFTLAIHQTGLGTGTAAIFRNGFYYSGTIQATGDPKSAEISGGLQGEFDEMVICGTETGTISYFASGTFQGWKVSVKSGAIDLSGVRVRGEAAITYRPGSSSQCTPDPGGNSGGAIHYQVRGFKQSFSTS